MIIFFKTLDLQQHRNTLLDLTTTNMHRKPIIKISLVRHHAKVKGKRVSKEFLTALDNLVRRKIEESCNTHNGGKKTLDTAVATYNGIY